MKCVIIAGGSAPSKELLLQALEGSSYLICADSGANCLYEYGIRPDYIIGDFDSIKEAALKHFTVQHCKIEAYPRDKDFTDTQLALQKAVELGAKEIIFLGCTGSRIDHILGNLGLIEQCLLRHISASIQDNNNRIILSDKPISIQGESGSYFSLQAFGGTVEDLCIEGAKFSLSHYNLRLGDPLTLSNEFKEQEVNLKFKTGILLILFSKD